MSSIAASLGLTIEECDKAMDVIVSERDLVEPLVCFVPLASQKG